MLLRLIITSCLFISASAANATQPLKVDWPDLKPENGFVDPFSELSREQLQQLGQLVPDQANKERKFYLFLESSLMRTEIVWRRVSPLCSFENNWSVMRMGFLAWSG
jgi:hypothetical protein